MFTQAATQQTSSNSTTPTAAGRAAPGLDMGPLEAETMPLQDFSR